MGPAERFPHQPEHHAGLRVGIPIERGKEEISVTHVGETQDHGLPGQVEERRAVESVSVRDVGDHPLGVLQRNKCVTEDICVQRT